MSAQDSASRQGRLPTSSGTWAFGLDFASSTTYRLPETFKRHCSLAAHPSPAPSSRAYTPKFSHRMWSALDLSLLRNIDSVRLAKSV